MESMELADESRPAEPSTKTVLVVDDDDGQRELIKHITAKEGFRVVEASSAPEALRLVGQSEPDAIVLDLMLPGMGGYEMARELQSLGAGNVPVIIVSARVMDKKSIDSLSHEPNIKDFVAKPPNPRALAAKLHSLLGTKPPSV